MPDWYGDAEKQLDECIDEIIRKNYIHWSFAHDSVTIKESKSAILGALVTIDEKVRDPFQATRQQSKEFEESLKPHKKHRKVWRRYPKEMESFLRDNIMNCTNGRLVELVRDRFGVRTTKSRLSNYMFLHGISRRKKKGWNKGRHLTAAHKRKIGEGVKRSHRKHNKGFNINTAKKISEMTWGEARRAGLSRTIWKNGQGR